MYAIPKVPVASFNSGGLIFCLGKFSVAVDGAISDDSKQGYGIKSVVKSAVGVYTLALVTPFRDLIHADVAIRGVAGASGVARCEIAKEDFGETGSLSIHLFDIAGDPVDVAAISDISYQLIVK